MMKITYVEALEIAMSKLSADDTFSTYMHNVHEEGDCVETKHSMQIVLDKLSALRDQQVKRNSAEKKPTKTQQANEGVKSHVLEVLASCAQPVTVSELMQADEELSQLSNQKVASLVRQLVDAGKVQRLEEKRKAYFTLVK